MMEKGQDQIPDEGFLMTKMPMYFIVSVDKILLCLGVQCTSTLADPTPNPNVSDVIGRRFEKVKNGHIFENWTPI
jgi:hypothetical protein